MITFPYAAENIQTTSEETFQHFASPDMFPRTIHLVTFTFMSVLACNRLTTAGWFAVQSFDALFAMYRRTCDVARIKCIQREIRRHIRIAGLFPDGQSNSIAAARCRSRMVDQTESERSVGEGSAEERCHHP